MNYQTRAIEAEFIPRVDPGASPFRQLGVLLIEDNPVLLKAIEKGFIKRGFAVWIASDGKDGVERYRRFGGEIDLVLSDLNMPVMDGVETLKALQSIEPRVRFCFMTGDTRPSTIAKLLELGSLRVFDKPFSSVAEVVDELKELATCTISTTVDVGEFATDGAAALKPRSSSPKCSPIALVASWLLRMIGCTSGSSAGRSIGEIQRG